MSQQAYALKVPSRRPRQKPRFLVTHGDVASQETYFVRMGASIFIRRGHTTECSKPTDSGEAAKGTSLRALA